MSEVRPNLTKTITNSNPLSNLENHLAKAEEQFSNTIVQNEIDEKFTNKDQEAFKESYGQISDDNNLDSFKSQQDQSIPANYITPPNQFMIVEPQGRSRPDVCCDCSSNDRSMNCRIFTLYMSQIVFIIITTMFIVFASENSSINVDSVLRSFNTIANSLSSDPILDLQVASSCPVGYTRASIGQWPGTRYGCNCGSAIYAGACGKRKRLCKGISSTDSFLLQSFNSTNEYICIKRATINVDYIRAASCPTGYTNCYPGFCFTGSTCPVSNVSLTDIQYSSQTYSYQGKYLNVYKNQNVMPMAGINLSYYGMPCFEDGRYDFFKRRYILHYGIGGGCGIRDYDRNAYLLGSTFDDYVLRNNNASGVRPQIENLPLYKTYRPVIPVTLVGKTRIETKTSSKCLNIDTNVIYGKNSGSGKLDALILTSVLVELLLTGNGFIISSILIFVGICTGKFNRSLKLTLMIFMTVFAGLCLILWIICAPIGASLVKEFKEIEDYVSSISDCFVSNQAKQAMSNYNSLVVSVGNSVLGYLYTLMSFRIILFVFIVIPSIYQCMKK